MSVQSKPCDASACWAVGRASELLLDKHLLVKKKATTVFFAKTERDLQRTDSVSQKEVAVQ
jgi:hypothetical protein